MSFRFVGVCEPPQTKPQLLSALGWPYASVSQCLMPMVPLRDLPLDFYCTFDLKEAEEVEASKLNV